MPAPTTGNGTADGFSDLGGSTYSELHTYINNIVETERYAIYRGGRSNTDDYNLFNPTSWLVDEWNGTGSYPTVAAFRTATGMEEHGLQGSPSFGPGTIQITNASIAIDKGLILPNFNDADSAWPFRGSGPDIGHYEADPAPLPPRNLKVLP